MRLVVAGSDDNFVAVKLYEPESTSKVTSTGAFRSPVWTLSLSETRLEMRSMEPAIQHISKRASTC